MDELSSAGSRPRILVLAAHPNWRESRVNRRLLAAAQRVPGVAVHDLYAAYPDDDIDAAAEQALVAAPGLLVPLHPVGPAEALAGRGPRVWLGLRSRRRRPARQNCGTAACARSSAKLFESSRRSGRTVLEVLGLAPHEARMLAMRFRRANLQLFERMYPHHADRAKVIAVTKQARRQLQEQLAVERAASIARQREEAQRQVPR